jgi:heme A synthase
MSVNVQEDWEAEFAKYKQSPEYQRVNRGMNLDEFKFIYWCAHLVGIPLSPELLHR